MRMIFSISAAALLVAACASSGDSRYAREYDRLLSECRASGGVLVPFEGPESGTPNTEYACQTRNISLAR